MYKIFQTVNSLICDVYSLFFSFFLFFFHIQLNPQHTIPVLDDNGKILCDSHAIATYLVNKHDSNHKLYPNDAYERACVDQRLYFDASTLFPIYKKCVRKVKFSGAFEQTDEDIATYRDALDVMEIFLKRGHYIAGDRLSLADFFVAGTLMQMEKLVPIDYVKYDAIKLWKNRLAELPEFYDLNTKHVERFGELIHGVIEKNRQAAKK